ncbi:MAG TPA: hypothetical protein VES40_06085 [Ilumatobacteraceae bacterium]|nr:hypothetical protein [Ilumatobacteraceae bacterium]
MTLRPRRRHTLIIATASLLATTQLGGGPAAAEPLAITIGGFRDGIYVPINDLDVTGPGDASVLANGNLAVTWAGSQFDATVDGENLQSLQTDLGLQGAVTLDLSARTAGDIDDVVEIVTTPLAQFAAGPVTVTPHLGVNMRISGLAEAGAQVSIVAPFNVSAALSKVGGHTSASAPERPSFEPEIGLPDAANTFAFNVAVDFEVTLTFMLSIEDVPVGGPVLLASLGTDLHLDPTSWDLDATTAVKYGWSFPDVTGAPQPPTRPKRLFPERRWNIAHSDIGSMTDVSTRWARAFDTDRYDDVGGVVPIGDELVVIEASGSVGGYSWMTRLDGTGHPTWQQQGTRPATVRDLAPTSDGGLVAVSSSGRIERFAADGTPQWARQAAFEGITTTVWTSVVATDGGVIVGGEVRSADGLDNAILVDVDDTGTIRWSTEIHLDDVHQDAQITDIGEAPNGDLIVVGQAHYYPDPLYDNQDALVMRVGRNGDVKNAFTLGGEFNDSPTGVAVQPDGSYVIVGDTTLQAGGRPRILMASFDSDDQLLWSSTYLDQPDTGYFHPRTMATGVTAVAHGDYVVSGTVDADAWLMRIDGSGMPVWSKTFISPGNDELTGVVAMPSGVVAYGNTSTTDPLSSGGDDIWIIRTNVDGMIHFDPDSDFNAVNGAVHWQSNDHIVRAVAATVTSPTDTSTDSAFGAVPFTAHETRLT